MTEITDDDVERAWNAYRTTPGSFREAIKAAIEAALSPPKPEIEVTEGMIDAARAVWRGYTSMNQGGIYLAANMFATALPAAYRAMESTRLKEAQERNPFGGRMYWDKNDRRQNGRVVMVNRRTGDRRGRDRFVKANAPQQFYGMTRD